MLRKRKSILDTMKPMQACPRCRATYPDGVSECPDDGAALLPIGMLPTEDQPIEPGMMVGEYRIDRKLGSGTFGDVYAGEQPVIGKRVAIKLLHRKFSSDAEVVSRFLAEARAVNRIRHRHIIDIFSFGLLGESRHYFVMELLDGLTLGELLHRERRLSLDTALPIFRGIASGLDAAHEASITHRDLKPDNVFLAIERDGSFFPKLLDFGIAKLVGEDAAHKTATGVAMGTPRYMSPEQCRGKPVDHRADIYSLGVVIHEALTGRPLFDGDSSMDVLFKHTNEPPPSMSSVCPDLPPELDEPVLAMLAKRPKQRPASAGEAVAALIERAKAAGKAESVTFASARVVAPAAAEAAPGDPTTGAAPRVKTDDPTVAVRPRRPANPEPSSDGPSRPGPVSTDAPTMAMAAADRDGATTGSVSVRVSTEVAAASASGTLLEAGAAPVGSGTQLAPDLVSQQVTLRSSGPIDTAAPSTLSATPVGGAVRRGPATWAVVGLGAAALIAGALALSRGGDRGGAAGTPQLQSAGATAPAPHATEAPPVAKDTVAVRIPVSPPEATFSIGGKRLGSAREPLVLPRSAESQAVRVELEGYEPATVWVLPDGDKEMPGVTLSPAPASAARTATSAAAAPSGTGKVLAKPKLHPDLARPPELGP